jgi:HSP20 family protein
MPSFAHWAAILVPFLEMIPSPFHGIFSSSLGSEKTPPSSKMRRAEEQPVPIPTKQPARSSGVGQVALDIFEYDNYYILKAPIAGVRLSDIDIDIQDNTIIIRGSRRQTDTIPEDQYYIKECFWGDFERKVTLPCAVDPRKVKATFNKECVLKILVPKEEKVKIIRIND